MAHFYKLLALLILGGAITLLALYVMNPLLPEQFSLGTTKPVIDDTVAEGVSITYTIPTDEAVEAATTFEAYIPPEQLVEEPVNISLPLDVVNQSYITAFNGLVNQGVLLEKQLKLNVAPAMNLVQTEAAAGNFLKMFEHMVAARQQIDTLNDIIDDFNAAILTYRATYLVPGMAVVVRTNSESLDKSAVILHTEIRRFSALLEKTVDGTVPSQQLISDTEVSNLKVVDVAADFGVRVTAVGEAVKVSRP